ncbi:hypothetical protein [Nocardioides iriomotensis]|jgi:hypothetical protein|uniref:Uncharacterized protein n=1 Tax=Nocardioides iriomotensis TaxID=715784 RepID=A0A4Q5J1I9_9ACTN|nr:hypothetical protein [Nocardioides iriomotensis]RYU12430.1 hypothetical protein ETU37_10555 [Nocardioides iriomotensis]
MYDQGGGADAVAVPPKEPSMLGPLPVLYRVTVVVVALLASLAAGAWLAVFTPVPTPTGTGLLVGLGLGVLSATVLVHQTPQRVR